MNIVKIVSLFLLMSIVFPIYSQEYTVVPQRLPEQEAVKQTEKLQQELNLNSDQAKHIYEINLRYARERLISNKRSDALERTKNKNAEIQQILSCEQNDRLQTKRYERSSIETQSINRNQPINSPGFRSSSEFRSNQAEMNLRNNNRPVNPNYQNQTDQPIRRSSAPTFRATQTQSNPYSNRPSSGGLIDTRRSETSPPTNNIPSKSQLTPSNIPRRIEPSNRPSPVQQNTPTQTRRSETPVNSSRR